MTEPTRPDPLGNSIGDAWESYFAELYRPGLAPGLLIEARRAFYGGASAVLVLVGEAALQGNSAQLRQLMAEAKEFINLKRQGIV